MNGVITSHIGQLRLRGMVTRGNATTCRVYGIFDLLTCFSSLFIAFHFLSRGVVGKFLLKAFFRQDGNHGRSREICGWTKKCFGWRTEQMPASFRRAFPKCFCDQLATIPLYWPMGAYMSRSQADATLFNIPKTTSFPPRTRLTQNNPSRSQTQFQGSQGDTKCTAKLTFNLAHLAPN